MYTAANILHTTNYTDTNIQHNGHNTTNILHIINCIPFLTYYMVLIVHTTTDTLHTTVHTTANMLHANNYMLVFNMFFFSY